jgi:hypothetical protein
VQAPHGISDIRSLQKVTTKSRKVPPLDPQPHQKRCNTTKYRTTAAICCCQTPKSSLPSEWVSGSRTHSAERRFHCHTTTFQRESRRRCTERLQDSAILTRRNNETCNSASIAMGSTICRLQYHPQGQGSIPLPHRFYIYWNSSRNASDEPL